MHCLSVRPTKMQLKVTKHLAPAIQKCDLPFPSLALSLSLSGQVSVRPLGGKGADTAVFPSLYFCDLSFSSRSFLSFPFLILSFCFFAYRFFRCLNFFWDYFSNLFFAFLFNLSLHTTTFHLFSFCGACKTP